MNATETKNPSRSDSVPRLVEAIDNLAAAVSNWSKAQAAGAPDDVVRALRGHVFERLGRAQYEADLAAGRPLPGVRHGVRG